MMNRKLISVTRLVVLATAVSLGSCATHRGGPTPLSALPDSLYGSERLARELRTAHELPLYRLADDSRPVVYRMSVLGAWGGVRGFRLEQRGDAWTFVWKGTGNDSGSTVFRLMVSDSARVSAAQADSLIVVIRASHHWTEPVQRCRMGIDGYRVVLEARVADEYYVQNCWVPQEAGAPAIMATMRAFARLSEQVSSSSR